MQRTLFVLRHGKALRGPEFDTDFERTLAARGKSAAALVGQYLSARTTPVELILSSAAPRALETAQIVQQQLDAVPLEQEERLYGASAQSWLYRLAELPDALCHVLIVGHNPGLEELVAELADDGSVLLKTCSLAELELAGEQWAGALAHGARLVSIRHPVDLER